MSDLKHLNALFHKADTDGDGRISFDELETLVNSEIMESSKRQFWDRRAPASQRQRATLGCNKLPARGQGHDMLR